MKIRSNNNRERKKSCLIFFHRFLTINPNSHRFFLLRETKSPVNPNPKSNCFRYLVGFVYQSFFFSKNRRNSFSPISKRDIIIKKKKSSAKIVPNTTRFFVPDKTRFHPRTVWKKKIAGRSA